jgi:two-component system sensor histidine kinase AlgZ
VTGDWPEKRKDDPQDRLFLPSFCDVGMVFAVVVMAELLAFLVSLVAPSGAYGGWRQLGVISLFMQLIALASAALLCIARPVLTRLSNTAAALVSYLMLLLVTAVFSEIAFYLMLRHADLTGYDEAQHAGFLFQNLGVSAVISALVLRYLYVRHQWRQQVEAEARARVQALQARMRPHFLFNSMNTIAALTRSQPEVAEEAVQDLADLFRVTLRDVEDSIPLKDELDFARRYLHIESLRLGERLRVEWDLADLPGPMRVPPLILQPLLENAIYHGIERMPEGGTIRITGRRRKDRILFRVANPLPSHSDFAQHTGNRIAQANIRARLELAYGAASWLRAGETDGSYQIELSFPAEQQT